MPSADMHYLTQECMAQTKYLIHPNSRYNAAYSIHLSGESTSQFRHKLEHPRHAIRKEGEKYMVVNARKSSRSIHLTLTVNKTK